MLLKNLEKLEDIWARLKDAFGDPELLLRNKLENIETMGSICKLRLQQEVDEKLAVAQREKRRK